MDARQFRSKTTFKSPKLPDIHARFYCNANEQTISFPGPLPLMSKGLLSDIAMFQFKYLNKVELAHAHYTFEQVKKQHPKVC